MTKATCLTLLGSNSGTAQQHCWAKPAPYHVHQSLSFLSQNLILYRSTYGTGSYKHASVCRTSCYDKAGKYNRIANNDEPPPAEQIGIGSKDHGCNGVTHCIGCDEPCIVGKIAHLDS